MQDMALAIMFIREKGIRVLDLTQPMPMSLELPLPSLNNHWIPVLLQNPIGKIGYQIFFDERTKPSENGGSSCIISATPFK